MINNELKDNNKEEQNKRIIKLNLYYQHLKLIKYFIENKIYSYKIVETNNYYSYTLEQRMKIINATTTKVMCKTIILENKNYDKLQESKYYKRYYMCIVQYTSEFNAEKIAKLLKSRQNTFCKDNQLSNKYFHFRLSKEEIAFNMSGYMFNCITPFLMKCKDMEIILPNSLINIYPYYFWLGGGDIELKVGISVQDFYKLYEKQIIIGDVLGK